MSVFKKIRNFMSPTRAKVDALENQNSLLKNAVNSLMTNNVTGGGKWPFGMSSTGRTTILSHYTARRNARDAYHDSLQARSVVTRMADSVADTGLRLEATPDASILGISEEEAEKWSQDVEKRFDAWARSKKQHRSETISFYQAQRLYQIFQHRDNDIFIRLYYDTNPLLVNPLQFSFIDPDQIRGDAYTSTAGFQGNFDGIERDARGREKTYNVWIKDGKGGYKPVKLPRVGKSGRLMMIHGFDIEYAGQGRGYSKLAHALQEFENITDFTAAQIKKAIAQSQIWGFVKPSDNEDSSNPFEGIMTNAGAGPAAEMFASEPQPTEGATALDADSLSPAKCYQVPEATMDTPGSMFLTNLKRGEDISVVNNTAPTESFATFVDSFTSYLSASHSMPLEVLLMKFGQNFSASRGALLLFWRVAEIWRREMATDFLDPSYEMWLSEEIAAGRVAAPGWSNPLLKAAWLKNNWIGSPPPDIDPAKVSKARKDNIEMGLTTIDRESRNLNGSSAEANKAKLKRELAGLPIVPWSSGGGGIAPTQGKEEESEED